MRPGRSRSRRRGGTTGDAQLADAALGERLVRHYGAKLARVIEESFDFDLTRLGSHD